MTSRNSEVIAFDTATNAAASFNGAIQSNNTAKGVVVLVDVTAITGTSPTLTAKVQYSIDGTNFHDLDGTNAVTASITATGRHLIRVYPGLTAAAPAGGLATANAPLPRLWRLAYTIGGTTPQVTFTSSATYLI